MSATHNLYNELYRVSSNNQFDKTELYKIITSENMNDQDEDGCTLLHLAASRCDLELVTFLLGKNVDVTKLDNGGWSALRFAIEAITETNFVIQDTIIKSLLEKNANIDEIEEVVNQTALHNAAAYGDVLKAQVLIANGASLSAVTFQQKTARIIAEESSYRDKARMLELLNTPVSTIKALTSGHSIFSSRNPVAVNDTPNQTVVVDSSSQLLSDIQPAEDVEKNINPPKH